MRPADLAGSHGSRPPPEEHHFHLAMAVLTVLMVLIFVALP
jgi:hypothetical protein